MSRLPEEPDERSGFDPEMHRDATSDKAWYEPLTPLRFLERSAAVFPDKIAIIDGDRRLTYRQFAEEAMRLAVALKQAGAAPGERVAFLAPNCAELLIAHFAVPLAGCALVALNTRLAADEIAYICQHSDTRFLFVSAELLSESISFATESEAIQQRIVIGDDAPDGWTTYEAFCAPVKHQVSELAWRVEDELTAISVNYTSGTTGQPKGVVYSHRGAYLNALGEVLHSQHSSRSVYLWTLPMFHCNGWCTAWAVTAIGGTHVCLPHIRATEIWNLIDTHRVTHLNGAPAVLGIIADAPEAHPLEHELVVTTAGAAPSSTIISRVEALGATVVHVYGLTEVYGPYTVCERQPSWDQLSEAERCQRLARQGVGMIQAERVRVVDEHMEDVASDGETMGEIVMRGNNVMLGYLNDPAATESAFAGGWFHSGDLGVVHTDGYVELRDRAKDIVISGGENISTIEVEACLMSHPDVLEVAVVGAPSERWGERPKAYVVLRPGKNPSERDLIEHVRSQIAHFKAPDSVEFLEELPRTSTGKVQKFSLRRR